MCNHSLMRISADFLHQPDTLQQPPRSFKPRKLLALITAVLLSALVAGIGGYFLGIRKNQYAPLSQPSPSPQPAMVTQIPATIAQSSYNQFTPFLSPLPTSPLIAEIPNCILTGHDAETTNWKTYTNTKYYYSFKYPTGANTVFNYKSNAPHDFNDIIYIKDPNDINWNTDSGRWIAAFDLGIITLANYPEEFNKYKNLLKKAYESIGEYIEDNGRIRYTRINILNQPAVRYDVFNNELTYISFIKGNVLYNINLSKEIFPLSCQILSTFKSTDQ
jgi:hypothetical protein